MTVTPVSERPTFGATHQDAFVVTVGRYADGRPARLTAGADGRSGGRAEHLTIYGDSQSGVTTVLRNLLADSTHASWDVALIDLNTNTVSDCGSRLNAEYDLARWRLDEQNADQRQFRLLLIDDLQVLARSRRFVHELHQFTSIAGRAGIGVVIGTHDLSLSGFGGRFRQSTLTRAALTQNLITMRVSDKPLQRAALRALGVDMDRFGTRLTHLTAGSGFLPRVSGQPIHIRQP